MKFSARKIRWLLEYLVFRSIVCVVDAVPAQTAARAAGTAARFLCRVLPPKLLRFPVARENLRRAYGPELTDAQADRIIVRMWIHLFRMVVEIVQLPRKLRLYNGLGVVQYHNSPASVRALCCGRPAIVLSGHFGNWELATAMFGFFGFPMGVVARDLDNPYLHRWFERWRTATGHRLISKKGGGGDMVQFLENRGALAMLGDQDAGRRGIFVPFFRHEASTFKSIALVALQHRAVICMGYARRLPDDFVNCRWVRFEMGCEDVIDTLDYEDSDDPVREITIRYTAALERVIRKSPEQYFWIHRRWKSQPRQRVRKQPAAAVPVSRAA